MRPVCPSMDPSMQVHEVALEILLVVPPRQSVDTRCGMFLEGKERRFEQLAADMVKERGEPLFLLLLPGSLPYALQPMGHACPAQRPVRVVLARIPLGPGPSLHRLRGGLLRFVRRLPCYYGRVRLPAFVHHWLRLIAFPMRTAGFVCRWPNAGYPKFRRDPSVRDVALDPGRAATPRVAASLILLSTFGRGLCPCGMPISWLNPTPRAAAVYASWPPLPSAHATLASRRLATPYLRWTFTSRSRQLCLAPSSNAGYGSGKSRKRG